MPYVDKYKDYLLQIPNYIKNCERLGVTPVFGYTSNLDLILRWEPEIFNCILEKHLKVTPSFKEGETIATMEDFARIVSYYVINGLGGEIEITRESVCTYLKNSFEAHTALGGTCAQGAAALGTLNIPVITHITDKSFEVCNLMDYNSVESIYRNSKIPIVDVSNNASPALHIVLQFSKGDVIKIFGKDHVVPASNRIILDYDAIHKLLPVDKCFLDYCEEHAKNISSYNISGFNAITDFDILTARVNEISRHLDAVKAKNPNCITYLESAHYVSSKIKKYVFANLPSLDILGMNEEELMDLASDISYTLDKENLKSIITALEKIVSMNNINGIVLHANNYSLYLGQPLKNANMEMSLTLGNLLSATKARTGAYGTMYDCAESLNLDLSPLGLAFAKELGNIKTSLYACLVPSRYMAKPYSTVGLGDTFTAGVQIGFMPTI